MHRFGGRDRGRHLAVLETARGEILRSGLGFDRCDIAVVTNVAADHLGLGGIDTMSGLANVKAVVPQSVFRDGVSVLNADNEWTADMARTARGEIIFFSMVTGYINSQIQDPVKKLEMQFIVLLIWKYFKKLFYT